MVQQVPKLGVASTWERDRRQDKEESGLNDASQRLVFDSPCSRGAAVKAASCGECGVSMVSWPGADDKF